MPSRALEWFTSVNGSLLAFQSTFHAHITHPPLVNHENGYGRTHNRLGPNCEQKIGTFIMVSGWIFSNNRYHSTSNLRLKEESEEYTIGYDFILPTKQCTCSRLKRNSSYCCLSRSQAGSWLVLAGCLLNSHFGGQFLTVRRTSCWLELHAGLLYCVVQKNSF